MILATVVTLAGLVLVVGVLAVERPLPDVARPTVRRAPRGRAGTTDATCGTAATAATDGRARVLGPDPVAPAEADRLADLPLRRVPLGYDRGATRELTGALAAVYAELAREVDPVTLARAWARARTGRGADRAADGAGPGTAPAAGASDGHDGVAGDAAVHRRADGPGAGREATGEGTRDDG